jgi:hypothetical protein
LLVERRRQEETEKARAAAAQWAERLSGALARACAALEAGRFTEARGLLGSVVTENPDNAEIASLMEMIVQRECAVKGATVEEALRVARRDGAGIRRGWWRASVHSTSTAFRTLSPASSSENGPVPVLASAVTEESPRPSAALQTRVAGPSWRKAVPDWQRIMATRKRKSLVACRVCHEAIHAGRPTRPKDSA